MATSPMVDGFRVIEQNDDFVLVDKASGFAMHKDTGVAGLVMQISQALGVDSLFPVHRLDKMTSGLLLLARNAQAASILSRQFQEGQVEKFYLALSDMKPRKKQGLIKGDMEKARRGSWKLCKSHNNPALTQFYSSSAEAGLRVFLLRPRTGKTHQIRVAMKSISAPIIGDQRYHSAERAELTDRGYLHAYVLCFDWQGERKQYCCRPREGELFLRETVQQQIAVWSDPVALDWPLI